MSVNDPEDGMAPEDSEAAPQDAEAEDGPGSRRLRSTIFGEDEAPGVSDEAQAEPRPDSRGAPSSLAADPQDRPAPDLSAAAPGQASGKLGAPPEPEETILPGETREELELRTSKVQSLAIRLCLMMAVVFVGVFVAKLVDLALGLPTQFQGLGVLSVYLVVLTVMLSPSLNPKTRLQWVVVISGFAGVILAIAVGSALARLQLQADGVRHTNPYFELAVEFGVMFAFWGLAALAFSALLRRFGLTIGTESEPSRGARPYN